LLVNPEGSRTISTSRATVSTLVISTSVRQSELFRPTMYAAAGMITMSAARNPADALPATSSTVNAKPSRDSFMPTSAESLA